LVDERTQLLSAKIVEIAQVCRRYRRIHDLLRPEFPGVNHKRVYRLYSQAQLAVRKRKKGRRALPANAGPSRRQRMSMKSGAWTSSPTAWQNIGSRRYHRRDPRLQAGAKTTTKCDRTAVSGEYSRQSSLNAIASSIREPASSKEIK